VRGDRAAGAGGAVAARLEGQADGLSNIVAEVCGGRGRQRSDSGPRTVRQRELQELGRATEKVVAGHLVGLVRAVGRDGGHRELDGGQLLHHGADSVRGR